ncbi:MAG: hypothetical protein BGP06_17815 [Rhizobiales bacterium 65-9]|mgnify:CR=1 FL=1|nr:GNAT family N-acetyltransferase [Hyphomicrobiales bacterium]OJY34704.1 MAG: hypothetical protein BGP06_17815 [Rhizobiales bacterium 65-9]
MLTVAAPSPRLIAEVTPGRSFAAERLDDFDSALAIAEREATGGTGTPFQGRAWLSAWRRAFAGPQSGVAAMAIVARDRATGELALVLPLAQMRRDGLVVIAAPDADVTDYNAPILGPAAPTDRAGARRLWAAVRRALPRADVIEISKAPRVLAGRANPLALLGAASPSTLSGNVIDIDTPFETFVRGFERKLRKELGREKRVFEAIDGARFEMATDPARAETILDALARMQAARIRALGRAYRLDDDDASSFYRMLVRDGLPRGDVALTALVVGDEIVAALLGVIEGDHYAMVRLGQAGAPWSHFSPGRLVIMETMRALRARGLKRFDFTIGDYDYKRRLGVAPVPLVDLVEAASWRGWPRATRHRAKAALRASPLARGIVRFVRGRRG